MRSGKPPILGVSAAWSAWLLGSKAAQGLAAISVGSAATRSSELNLGLVGCAGAGGWGRGRGARTGDRWGDPEGATRWGAGAWWGMLAACQVAHFSRAVRAVHAGCFAACDLLL